jgi:CheY-like chemotaxis protein
MPSLAIHAIALRQIILNVLEVMTRHLETGAITLSSHADACRVQVRFVGNRLSPQHETGEILDDALLAAKELVERSGGKLEHCEDGQQVQVNIFLPVLDNIPVLVIDDNEHHIQFLRRLIAGTRYRLFETAQPDRALKIAEDNRVQAVIIDVMMPRADGWTILHDLRSNPTTAALPMIVCSIMPMAELALSLGADSFLHKPVNGHELLETLDRLTRPLAKVPHSPPV